jgi:hypothetical protein
MVRVVLALALLSACASLDPFHDVAGAQQRLDRRGIAFAVTPALGPQAFVLEARSTERGGLEADPMAAALAAAPRGCRVVTITAQEEGASYLVDYDC